MAQLRVKRANLDEWERINRDMCKNIQSCASGSKISNNKKDAQDYIKKLGAILNLTDSNGWDTFINQLCVSIESAGPGVSEYKDVVVNNGSKDGKAKYVLVATYVDNQSKVSVCYAYHNISQYSLENTTFDHNIANAMIDWLRVQSCKTIQSLLPPDAAPQLFID